MYEGTEYNISKLTYQRLNKKNTPSYLPVEIATKERTMRSNNSGSCVDHSKKMLSTNCRLIFDQMKVK